MRVLVAPDKFKGSLTAAEVAGALGEGLAAAGVEARLLPLADGGDGSVAAALHAGFRAHEVTVVGADGRPVRAQFASDGHTAVVEVASTCGLATLSGVRAPMTSSSLGFGQAVAAAAGTGVSRIVLALGGSASTDGGAGMLAAFGARFLDETGAEISPSGATLDRIAGVDISAPLHGTELAVASDVGNPLHGTELHGTELAVATDVGNPLHGIELIVATDVGNPLLGPDGAAAVFGPQKGASGVQINQLEAGLDRLARALPVSVTGRSPLDLASQAGAGAAGGIGFAALWLGARQVSGAEFFLDLLGFDEALEGCRAVVVGEGHMDSQTLWGKLPAVVAARAAPRPAYAVVGRNSLTADEQQRLGLSGLYALTDLTREDPSRDPALSRRLVTRAGQSLGGHLHKIFTARPIDYR